MPPLHQRPINDNFLGGQWSSLAGGHYMRIRKQAQRFSAPAARAPFASGAFPHMPPTTYRLPASVFPVSHLPSTIYHLPTSVFAVHPSSFTLHTSRAALVFPPRKVYTRHLNLAVIARRPQTSQKARWACPDVRYRDAPPATHDLLGGSCHVCRCHLFPTHQTR